MKKFSCSGFALLEILAMTVLMLGLAGLFISFAHNKQKQQNDVETGATLALIANDVLKKSTPGGACNIATKTVSLDTCLSLSSSMKDKLNQEGINPDDVQIEKTYYDNTNSPTTISLIMRGNFSEKTASIYAQTIFNHLTTESLSYLSSQDRLSIHLLPFSYKVTRNAYSDSPNDSMSCTFYVDLLK